MKAELIFTNYSMTKLNDFKLSKEQVLYVILNGTALIIDEEFLQFTWKGIEVTTCLELRTVYTIQKFEVNDWHPYDLEKLHMDDYSLAMSA